MRYLSLALLWLFGTILAAQQTVPVPAADAIYQLTLQKAIFADNAADGRDLQISLDVHGGKIAGSFGQAATFNKMPAALDCSGLTFANGTLRGALKVAIPWDGFVPRDGKPLAREYALDATLGADGKMAGTWALRGVTAAGGNITGTQAARPADTDLMRLTLACENAVDHAGPMGNRRFTLVVVLKNGKAIYARAIPRGSIADVSCEMEVPKFDITLQDGKLAGALTLKVTPQQAGQEPVTVYDYQFDGYLIGNAASGSMAIVKDGRPFKETGVFMATARRGDPPAIGDCLYKITLHHALGQGKFIDVYLSSRDGKLTGGFASSPNFNNAMHLVDISKLKLAAGTLTGDLGVTVLADPWVPADHQPIPCTFALNATIADGEIRGGYTGMAGRTQVAQSLDGALDEKVKLENITGLTLRLENGLAGSGNHMARAFVSAQFKDGKVVGGGVGNNHDKTMAGKVTGGELTFTGDQFTLRLEFTLTSAAGATLGKYVTTAAGTFVGTMSAGAFTCTHETGRVKEGSFWASVSLAK